ncbi:MAG TPA: AtpZ/AtpI family protein [Chitinophagales bacterium]|nr:AtpZ/AtpI family protein [Chitinophagales bacterium]HLP51424.1 AtpZ/AtpI family protein [Chitinophagales bacterium]
MKQEFEEGKKQVNNYLKYSGIGFQIAGVIGVGVAIGYGLDKWLHTPGPYFTAGFALIFIVLAMYVAFKDFLRKPEE